MSNAPEGRPSPRASELRRPPKASASRPDAWGPPAPRPRKAEPMHVISSAGWPCYSPASPNAPADKPGAPSAAKPAASTRSPSPATPARSPKPPRCDPPNTPSTRHFHHPATPRLSLRPHLTTPDLGRTGVDTHRPPAPRHFPSSDPESGITCNYQLRKPGGCARWSVPRHPPETNNDLSGRAVVRGRCGRAIPAR
jgi:hypothetical protein